MLLYLGGVWRIGVVRLRMEEIDGIGFENFDVDFCVSVLGWVLEFWI